MQTALAIHILSVVVWVGGMFFAYMALRPAAVEILEPPARLRLWSATFKRFFFWVWVAIALILLSGYGMIFGVFGGFAKVQPFVHIMNMLGLIMMLIFGHVYFAGYGKLKRAIAAEDWTSGAAALNQIRLLVAINTVIGILTIITATIGRALF